MTNIGIIGQGFVGSAIRDGLKSFYSVNGYDIVQDKCWYENYDDNIAHANRLSWIIEKSDIVFMCIPTPMRKNGLCDTRMLEAALNDAYEIVKKAKVMPKHSGFLDSQKTKKTFVIKSTVPPGTTEALAKRFTQINLCFSPEFLTEANHINDFKYQTRIILGGDGAKIVKQMYRKPFPNTPIIITKSSTAEMVKYFTNCFLAAKVTFANQMYEICQAADIDYDKVCEYSLYDDRIGKSHLAVPGPDGDYGFGGHCFPKDLAAMVEFGNNLNAETGFLKEIEALNNYYRTNKDWEKMKGRAISDD
tara:strand:+ start:29511 stop:30422 length:912 start_codon:yes stop_codon:yes gene_type:complete